MMTDEADIVAAFKKRLYYTAPKVKVVGIPNAGRRSRWEIARAKKEGLATGFPDCLVIWPGGGEAFIEFKTPKGRLTEAQSEWQALLVEYGFRHAVCRSADDAIEFLRMCGAPVREVV